MDTLSAMRTFVSIVDGGSLTAAAEALDRSQPTIVRTLAALESHLGTRLLQRTTRRMSLTPDGSQYLERCRQIIADVEEAERAISQDELALSGFLRLTAPVQFGQMHVAPLLTRFLALHPRIVSDLVLLDRNIDLVDEGIDLAIRIGELPDSGFIAIPVGEVRRVVCASPALLATLGEPARPEALAALPCLPLRTFAHSGNWVFRDDAKDVKVKARGPLSCNHVGTAIDACIDGTGFGRFLSYQVQEQLRFGQLQRVLVPFEPSPMPVNIVYAAGRFATARQRALADYLKTELRERVFFAD